MFMKHSRNFYKLLMWCNKFIYFFLSTCIIYKIACVYFVERSLKTLKLWVQMQIILEIHRNVNKSKLAFQTNTTRTFQKSKQNFRNAFKEFFWTQLNPRKAYVEKTKMFPNIKILFNLMQSLLLVSSPSLCNILKWKRLLENLF